MGQERGVNNFALFSGALKEITVCCNYEQKAAIFIFSFCSLCYSQKAENKPPCRQSAALISFVFTVSSTGQINKA